MEDGKRKGSPSAHTVQAYVNTLLESYFYYDIKRFDIKGKEYLRTLGKVDNTEVDFIATKMDEKMVLSLDTGSDASYDGIKSLNLINWLIGKA